MHNRQGLAVRLGVLFCAVLLLPLVVAEAQLHVSRLSKNGAPSLPPAVDVPANATLDYSGHAWECNRGYQRSGNECLVVKIPVNATLDYTGHAWECEQGYQRFGDQCTTVDMPANATLDYTGHAWECKDGYRLSGSQCITVDMPANATLDYSGHAWECKHRYQRSGNQCIVVDMPANAILDYSGHAWECEESYRRVGDICKKRPPLPKTAMYGSSAFQEPRVNPPQQHNDTQKIQHIQEQLKRAGFDPGPMDGILGPQTIDAIQRYLATR